MMKKLKGIVVLVPVLAFFLPACASSTSMQYETIRIAVLPIIDSLPMYTASQEGLFEERGVDVEFVPVASAPERDQLLAAGQVDGTINETLSVMLFNQESTQLQVVRYAQRPSPGYGHFFILSSAESGITSVEGLKGVEIGVSQGTLIEYVTQRLLEQEGFAAADIQTIAVPRIPDRMSMLASGALDAGVMPDPLAALAVQQGSVIVSDDSENPEYGYSVYSFRSEYIEENPQAVRAFLSAIEDSVSMINRNPEEYKSILGEQDILPSTLTDTYAIPPFPEAGVPTLEEWNDAAEWLKQKGLLQVDVSYEGSVVDTFLPALSHNPAFSSGDQFTAADVPATHD